MAVFNAEYSAGFVPDGTRRVGCRNLMPRLRGPRGVSSNRATDWMSAEKHADLISTLNNLGFASISRICISHSNKCFSLLNVLSINPF
jgi:hypothetical protein